MGAFISILWVCALIFGLAKFISWSNEQDRSASSSENNSRHSSYDGADPPEYTTSLSYDLDGHVTPYGGYTSEGYPVYGHRDSEGREQSVTYTNKDGHSVTSEDLYGDDNYD